MQNKNFTPSLQSLLGGDMQNPAEGLLDALPAAIYTTDAEGRITSYNEAAAELWGVRPELQSQKFCGSWKLYWPDGTPLPHDQCPMALALQSQSPVRGMEAVAERPDGTRVSFLAFPTPLFDAAGALAGAVNMLVDLGAHHETAARLRRSEARYRAIFDNAQVSVWEEDFSDVATLLDEIRATGVRDLRAYLGEHPERLREAVGRVRVKGVNAHSLKLFEAEPEDSLLGSLDRFLIPETVPIFVEILVALWEGRRRLESETVVRTLKGRLLDVIVTVAFAGERFDCTIVSVHDITQRKAAALDAQRLAAIVGSSNDAILAKTLDGIITNWNDGAEHLFGYTAEEAVGKPVTMLIPEERRDEEAMILAAVRRGERVDHYDTVRQRKDGSLVHISLTVSPIKAADGTIIGASKIARDITERIEAQEQQHLLLREMSHRVKNLLALSSSIVSLSARCAASPEELAEAVKARLHALALAHDLILPDPNDADSAARNSTKLHDLINTIVSPHDEVTDAQGSRVSVRGTDVEVSGRSATGFALLLHEFATNAAKYGALSTAEGQIEITCSEEAGNFVMIWKERGGPPITQEIDGEGFGSLLSRGTVEGQLRGQISREWAPEGLTLRILVPRDRLAG
ncbi:MAG: PAS domain S-box protein [Kiloniellaceae bacterium]